MPAIDQARADSVTARDLLHLRASRHRLRQNLGAEARVVHATLLAHNLYPLNRSCFSGCHSGSLTIDTIHASKQIERALITQGGSGRTHTYLPPYSPDFNPIENAFSKLKAFLRKAAARTIDELWNVIREALPTFTPQDCANYFTAAGYEPD